MSNLTDNIWAIHSIPTVGWSDVSLQWPTLTNTTIADHGRRRRKWPSYAPHEALRSVPMHQMDGENPPSKWIYFLGCWGCVWPSKHSDAVMAMCIARTKERFEDHTHPWPPPKYIRKLRGLSPIYSKCRRGSQGLMWGARRPFPPAAAMVVVAVTPVVFCDKATEKYNNNTKISCL